MAKKRKSEGGSSGGSGGGNTGLIITLVIFILATITLGVTTYTGYSEQESFVKAKKDADTKAKTNLELRDEEQIQKAILSVLAGLDEGVAKGEGDKASSAQDEIAANRDKPKPGQKYSDLAAKVTAKYNNFGLRWDPAQNRLVNASGTAVTLFDVINKQREDLIAERKANDDLKKVNETAKNAHETAIAELKADVKKQTELAKQKSDDYNKLLASKAAEFVQAKDEAEKNNQQYVKESKDKADLEAAKNKEIKELKQKLEDLKLVREKLEGLLTQRQTDLIETDSPKGKIERFDYKTGIYYVNLGSADNLRPQVSFSIYGGDAVGKGATNRQRKGGLEVTNILGPHLAAAKITELTSSQNPIVTGDLLYNPSWNRGTKTRIAIAGIIDLNGDGLDDNAEFIRNLETQGVIVDQYLDLRDLSLKGTGITLKTDFLVIGDAPTFDASAQQVGATERDKRKLDINGKMTEMQTKAKELGVQVITSRRYLALIGYKLPRNYTTADYDASRYSPKVGTTATAEPKKDGEKEEGKEK
jgi:hypothetical protein